MLLVQTTWIHLISKGQNRFAISHGLIPLSTSRFISSICSGLILLKNAIPNPRSIPVAPLHHACKYRLLYDFLWSSNSLSLASCGHPMQKRGLWSSNFSMNGYLSFGLIIPLNSWYHVKALNKLVAWHYLLCCLVRVAHAYPERSPCAIDLAFVTLFSWYFQFIDSSLDGFDLFQTASKPEAI